MRLKRLRIPFAWNLFFNNTTVVALIIILAITGIKQFSDILNINTSLRAHSDSVSRLENTLIKVRLMALESALIGNTGGSPPDPRESIKKLKTMREKINKELAFLTDCPTTAKLGQGESVAAVKKSATSYLKKAGQTFALMNEGEILDASTNETEAAKADFGSSLATISVIMEKSIASFEETMQSKEASIKKKFSGIGIIAVLIAILGGYILYRSAQRDIYSPVRGLIERLDRSTGAVNNGADSINASSTSLADDASKQAAGLEEVSATVEELTSTSRLNADNSQEANKEIQQTIKVVDQAISSMDELNSAIMEIAEASSKTSKIIKTIDEIAFQTNLLALNAAVEAARAGEAGAGFAVVAEEVRNLAMRSAEAANSTSSLIETTGERVERGTSVVTQTRQDFDQVVKGVKASGQLTEDINQASSQQAQGVEQINSAVAEIDRVTQQNAANAEELSATSQEMTAQAEELRAVLTELVAMVGSKNKNRGAGPAADKENGNGSLMLPA